MGKERIQANFRIDEEDQRMVFELRRALADDGRIPTETEVWRQALRQMYDRTVRKVRK